MVDEQKQEKPKEPKDMTLGELVTEMISTDRKCVELERTLAGASSKTPTDYICEAQVALLTYRTTYKNLQEELDEREKKYKDHIIPRICE